MFSVPVSIEVAVCGLTVVSTENALAFDCHELTPCRRINQSIMFYLPK